MLVLYVMALFQYWRENDVENELSPVVPNGLVADSNDFFLVFFHILFIQFNDNENLMNWNAQPTDPNTEIIMSFSRLVQNGQRDATSLGG